MNQGLFFMALLIATFTVVGVWGGTTIYQRYTGLTRSQSALLSLLAIVLALWPVAFSLLLRPSHHSSGTPGKPILFNVMLPLLVLPFATRLYRKWIGGHLTEAEKLPGIDGVRAWLGVGNVICAVLIPLCVQGTFEPLAPIYQPVTLIPLLFGLLLAYPLLNIASHSAQPTPVAPAEDLSKEREKVLQLLEAGKISAADSAELLNALAHNAPQSVPKPAAEINPHRKLVLIGAAILLLGFFLPWFAINPNAEANEMAAHFQHSMNQMMPGNAMPQMNLSLPDATAQIHAGDLAHGLGWWILALGIGAAVLPFFATTLETALQKKIILAALGIGAVLLIYLLSDAIKYVSFGILLALAGYALEVVGTLREQPITR